MSNNPRRAPSDVVAMLTTKDHGDESRGLASIHCIGDWAFGVACSYNRIDYSAAKTPRRTADRLQEFSFGGAKITLEKSLQEGATIIEKILTGSVSTFHNSKRRIPRHFLSHRAGPASK